MHKTAAIFYGPSLPVSVSQRPRWSNVLISPILCVHLRKQDNAFQPLWTRFAFFFLLVCAFWDSCVCIFCVCVVVNTWAWGYNAHTALVVFLGVLLSKWLPRIASTRPSKRSEICALGLTLHPAIVYIYFCINNNEN